MGIVSDTFRDLLNKQLEIDERSQRKTKQTLANCRAMIKQLEAEIKAEKLFN